MDKKQAKGGVAAKAKAKTPAKQAGKVANVRKRADSAPIEPCVNVVAPPRAMTYQQRIFVAEYAKDRNGHQAAIRAGYSEATASQQASRLLRNVQIRTLIDETVSRISERAELTAEKVLREVSRLAFFDPRKMLNEDGSPKPMNELDDDTAACIAGLEISEIFEGVGEDRAFVGYMKKYKVADKNSALDKAMKHLGLYEKDNEQIANPLTSLLQRIAGTGLPIVKDDAE